MARRNGKVTRLPQRGPIELRPLERMAARGLVERDQRIQQEVLLPLQMEWQQLLRELETAHGLEVGALGSTHALNLERLAIEPMPTPAPAEPEEIDDSATLAAAEEVAAELGG